MSQGSRSSQPLSVGNVVSTAVRLYRSHLKQYLGVALMATLWGLPPFIAAIVFIAITAIAGSQSSGLGFLVGFLFTIGWAILMLYCASKALMNTAIISRLAYGDLVSQPESTETARRKLEPKSWRFLMVAVLVNLLLFAVNFGLGIAGAIPQGVIGAVVGTDSPLFALLALVIRLAVLAVYYWVWAHWFIPEVPVAVEENVTVGSAVSRSWDLAKGSATRILLVILVASLITIPIYVLAMLPFIFTFIAALSNPLAMGSTAMMTSILSSLAVGVLLLFGLGIFVMPFWQAVKAVVYYDLRSRREGLGLQLRNNS